MANINLLPWREALREKRQKEFYGVIFLVVVAALAIVLGIKSIFDGEISHQNNRNGMLQREIGVLDGQIKEIRNLRKTRKELIERMELIQALQGNRPVIVRLFDEMVRSVPEDLIFTAISVEGNLVNLKGLAKSNNRVAALMRNFDESEWFSDPKLIKVKSKSEGANEFEVSVMRVEPTTEEEEG